MDLGDPNPLLASESLPSSKETSLIASSPEDVGSWRDQRNASPTVVFPPSKKPTPEPLSLRESLRLFPKSIYFMIGNEFCERFSYYGLRAILVVYLSRYLGWSDNQSATFFNVFMMVSYLSAILGGGLADSSLNKYRTMLIFSIVYATGQIILATTAIPNVTGTPPSPWGALLGLVLIGLGTGGIKPVANAFGAEQLPTDRPELIQAYFSVYYFVMNAGSVSMIITPKLRADVACYGANECYSLAFGIPAILMVVAIVVFLFGRPWYRVVRPKQNVLVDVARAGVLVVRTAWARWRSGGKGERPEAAVRLRFGAKFVADMKAVGKILVVFLPTPLFWTLYDQQGSRWTLQAEKMKLFGMGALGQFQPDMMQSTNTVFLLIMIPLFQYAIYPAITRLYRSPSPLQRMAVGMLFCAAGFVLSGFVQVGIDSSTSAPSPAAGSSMIRLVNACTQAQTLHLAELPGLNISSAARAVGQYISVGHGNYTFSLISEQLLAGASLSSLLASGAIYTVLAHGTGLACNMTLINDSLSPFLEAGNSAKLRIIGTSLEEGVLSLTSDPDGISVAGIAALQPTNFNDASVVSGPYTLTARSAAGHQGSARVDLDSGALYSVFVMPGTELELIVHQEASANEVSILWQAPQYFAVTVGEILFSITGLELAYNEAPDCMKAVIQAFWLFTTAFGDLVLIIIGEAELFPSDSVAFFSLAALLVVVVMLFIVVSMRYQYAADRPVDPDAHDEAARLLDDEMRPGELSA